MRVRPAVPGDAATLARIDYDTWTPRRHRPVLEAADVAFFERSHGGGPGEVLVATLPEAVGGFAVITTQGVETGRLAASLTTIAVDPFHRRRRVGTALLLAAVLQAERRGVGALSVSAPRGDQALNALLAATGFRRDRRSKPDAVVVAEEACWMLTAEEARRVGPSRLRT